jgi:predicted acylesterase/phospholipase RssA
MPNIQHLVLSGGGAFLFTLYGILRDSQKANFWELSNIQSIYGTSAGAISAAIIALDYDWDTLDKYLIKRPWHNVFKMDMYSIMNSFQKRGMLDIKVVEQIYEPLLTAKDISIDITLQDFYDITKKEIHFFTTDYDIFELVDISYKTHPTWKLTEAVYASCCLPILFIPFVKDGKTYVDGSFFSNYPIGSCCKNVENTEEIFGIRKGSKHIDMDTGTKTRIKKEGDGEETLVDYIFQLLSKIVKKMHSNVVSDEITVKNELYITFDKTSIYDIYLATTNIPEREKLIEKGVNAWNLFYKYREHAIQISDTLEIDESKKVNS